MNSRERFQSVLQYAKVDRAPYFEEEIRQEVIDFWRRQGMPPDMEPSGIFPADRPVEVELDLEPHPSPVTWPASREGLEAFQRLLDPGDPSRFPGEWTGRAGQSRFRDHVLLLYVHEGFFLSMGVDGWCRFAEVIDLVNDDPLFVREMMEVQGRFAAAVVEKALGEIEIDAAVFSEPIGGNHGPLISPRMYQELVLPGYDPLLEVLGRRQVKNVVFKTFANARLLLPSILKRGFNCLWACEVNVESMDYRSLRREYGRDLRLIGGIDLDSLRRGQDAIRQEIFDKVPALLAEGGYIPAADGRIRTDVTFENYLYYRRLLDEVVGGSSV